MKRIVHTITTAAVAVVMCAAGFAQPTVVDQPFMEKAKDNLQSARNYLNKATADKGGHRNKAVELVNQAINAVNNGIAYDRTHRSSQPILNDRADEIFSELAGTTGSDQPNMQAAKDEVQKAIENLNRASADKGGWRNKALGFSRSAIEQINKGMAFDRRN